MALYMPRHPFLHSHLYTSLALCSPHTQRAPPSPLVQVRAIMAQYMPLDDVDSDGGGLGATLGSRLKQLTGSGGGGGGGV